MADDRQPVALVTDFRGSAGASICMSLAQAGFAVLVNGGHEEVFEIQSIDPSAAIFAVPFDISSEGSVRAAFAQGLQQLGGIDVLVNNLYFWNEAALDNITEEMWAEVINIGIKGSFYCCRQAATVMKAQQSGKIIQVIGTSAFTGVYTQYASGCAAVHSLTKSLAKELAPHVRVNSIATGLLDEPWIDDGGPELRQMLTKDVPLKRLCRNDDLSEAVCYLACGADFMTGQMLVLDGGESM